MTSETIQQGVQKVLEAHPEARDNYNWLWYLYLKEILKLKIYIPFNALNKIPSTESISRAARKLWEEERRAGSSALMPSKEVQIKRLENEQKIREWATKPSKATSFSGGIYGHSY